MDYSNEVADSGTTFYSAVTALDGSAHDTAIFVPDKFHVTTTVDVILYFHGFNDTYADLRSYIHRPNTRPLRKAAGDDGRFALVIPWLKNRSDASYIVGSSQAFDVFMSSVLGSIPTASTDAVTPSLNLVLSAHSGGGKAMSKAITLSSAYIDRVVSAWGFDCMYADHSSDWSAWASAHPQSTLYVYYTDSGGTAANSKTLDSATSSLINVSVARAAVGHDEVPKQYFPDLLSTM